MTLFWILGFIGLDMLMTHFAVKRAKEKGREAGFDHGYDCGRIDAERWWMQAEIEVQKEREKIWREE